MDALNGLLLQHFRAFDHCLTCFMALHGSDAQDKMINMTNKDKS
jgi:hypothetical protein